jgi:drug/metabolite transporter (DMT)-like permease
MPSGIEWGYLLAMGIFATLSQWFVTKAYELTKAGIVGVISYSNILFSLTIGIALGDDIPNFGNRFGYWHYGSATTN